MGKSDCNVERALNIIGGKWSTLIVRDLIGGTKRFSELQSSITGVSGKSLTQKLKVLERNQVIIREAFAEVPPRVEYSLTPYGLKLESVISALNEWGRITPPRITTSA